jgi:hypothetical protein
MFLWEARLAAIGLPQALLLDALQSQKTRAGSALLQRIVTACYLFLWEVRLAAIGLPQALLLDAL